MKTRKLQFTGKYENGSHTVLVDDRTLSVSEACLKSLLELALATLDETPKPVTMTSQMAGSVKRHLGDGALAGYKTKWSLLGSWKITVDPAFIPVAEAVLPGERTRQLWSQVRGSHTWLTHIHNWIRDRGQFTQWCLIRVAAIGFAVNTFAQTAISKQREEPPPAVAPAPPEEQQSHVPTTKIGMTQTIPGPAN